MKFKDEKIDCSSHVSLINALNICNIQTLNALNNRNISISMFHVITKHV